MLKILDQEISILLSNFVGSNKKKDVYIDTCFEILKLSKSDNLRSEDFTLFEVILRRFDITNFLYLFYDNNEKNASETLIDELPYGLLLICLIFKQLVMCESKLPDQREYKFKKFNVLFKSIDKFDPQRKKISKDVYDLIDRYWNQLSMQIPYDIQVTNKVRQKKIQKQEKVIPMTVLFYEGPIGRAFLSSLKSLNLKPKKIISIIPNKDLISKKELGKWLPDFMQINYIKTIQKNKIHYWPKLLERRFPDVIRVFREEINYKFGISVEAQIDSTLLKPLDEYSSNNESILIDSLSDNALFEMLLNENRSSILYTGGGIMPPKLLDLEHLKFIHIHPGFLPNIRGADCILWSNLLHGKSSASSFYMAKGIDTGDILKAEWLPSLNLNLNSYQIDDLSKYRMIFSFIDPWVRSVLLQDLVLDHSDFFDLYSTSQNLLDGHSFYFMHQKLRSLSLESML